MINFILKSVEWLEQHEALILLTSVIVTLVIYKKNKSDDLKSRATMIYFQIKEIEKNMQYIEKYCVKDNLTWSGEFHKSKLIFNNNLWDENKIYLSRRMSNDDYDAMENFYSVATSMLNEQLLVKRFFLNSIESRQRFSDEKQYEKNLEIVCDEGIDSGSLNSRAETERKNVNKALALGTSEYLPSISNEIIQRNISEFKELSNSVVFEHLKRIARMK